MIQKHTTDGDDVGEALGATVGLEDGEEVDGLTDGDMLGEAVGLLDGAALGEVVGLVDGLEDGDALGEVVGIAGEKVGLLEGD